MARSNALPAAATAPRRRWWFRIPWVAVSVTVAVVLSGGFRVEPIRDLLTGGDVPGAYLSRPAAYVLLAPLSNSLDTLVLLSVPQHAGLLGGLVTFFVAWRLARWRIGRATWRSHTVGGAALLVAILGTYAAAALLPRPMAALEVDGADVLRVDFHAHTDASHDGRASVAQRRAWHRRAGFDAVFITDHGTVAGAERGMADNPARAGEGVMLLQSIEVTWNGEHVSILGAQRTYVGLLTDNLRDVDVEGLRMASLIGGREPVVIWNHPRDLERLPAATGTGTSGVRAIEILNGAPDAMHRMRQQRAAIASFARANNLALTSGTDNHGWGYAAPGWTLMRVANWRGLSADALALQVESVVRNAGFDATRVVERRVADPGAMLAASAFTVPARMLTTISTEERVAWIAWTWALTAALWLYGSRRRSG